jgi:hypothetical protein
MLFDLLGVATARVGVGADAEAKRVEAVGVEEQQQRRVPTRMVVWY